MWSCLDSSYLIDYNTLILLYTLITQFYTTYTVYPFLARAEIATLQLFRRDIFVEACTPPLHRRRGLSPVSFSLLLTPLKDPSARNNIEAFVAAESL